jgi:hypothetical protein
LHRKKPNEHVERFRRRLISSDARDLQGMLAGWATEEYLEVLRSARPELPESLSDRQQDVSEPLLAVADIAGSEWGRLGRGALIELFGSAAANDESIGVTLLYDIRRAFGEHDRLSSKALATALMEIEGAPWLDWNHGKGINANTVARLLRKFSITPRTIRFDGETAKGYFRESFEDAWSRYLRPDNAASPSIAVTPSQTAPTLTRSPLCEPTQAPEVTVQESEESPANMPLVTPVTVQTFDEVLDPDYERLIGEL